MMAMKHDIKTCFFGTVTCGLSDRQNEQEGQNEGRCRANWKKLCCCFRMKSERQEDNDEEANVNENKINVGATERRISLNQNSLGANHECLGD